ncbi:glycosyltransferase family 4 protein [Leptospira sp. 2 VSF19]|uniref:Glycosyltransferase family 4 protein n=1 Tax=Leptospira soteropolitanensis TaxID=2950025 RepID=A0AAW5VKV5_9LEPT|nr:glycosyltransferase family 1 protein [Leptospira soteropolitanensis]MCW7493192.1 glycosyltransferase family 4 protein [Leptospira soteropolitanensis]MCW7500739.1 glycosyltransferase family 4 protein [Leptospira soteropolitanensis]MCW7523042.1 glycosyltransferase family 4 protein [Leptospira soteropolitanensis]MCW7526851.1 glycosyltransferase family 4 protein [Leptospira soteropolitanensis]MCW7530760.1 glycosyltransferase family 4 protein [Leptospira soteropolitanensis]
MKVLFDHQIFFQNKYGGITKIFFEIFKKLDQERINYSIPLDLSSYEDGKIFSQFGARQINQVKPFSLYGLYKVTLSIFRKLGLQIPDFLLNKESGIQRFSLSREIKFVNEEVVSALTNNEYTVFHPTYYHRYYLNSIEQSKTKLVLTIHDCVHELFPEYYGSNNFLLRNREILSKAADRIVCVSNSTKDDFLSIYNHIPKEKVFVIHNAGDLSKEPVEGTQDFGADYILFVGNRGEYKNFEFLLKVFSSLSREKKLILVCAGGKSFSPKELKNINGLGLSDKVKHVSFSSDTVLANLYRNAKLFVYPSLYEGFGIPLLEAMSVGCPVFCSDIKVFKEVAGDAAEYFDPKNATAFCELLLENLNSTHKLESLRMKGYERVKAFSWDKCTNSYLEIYKELSKV